MLKSIATMGGICLGKSGLDTVRAVSIDDDWSALRFRKLDL